MLRRFRTWLADVIRPADVQPDPAPVVVAAEQPVIKMKSRYAVNRYDASEMISTKVFATIIGYPCQTIIAWKNGPCMFAGKTLPKHSGQKHAVMWDRSECFVFADHLKRSGKLMSNAQFDEICMTQLGEMLGVTRGAAWHIAKGFHMRNPSAGFWRMDKSGKRVITRDQAIQIGLERAGIAV